jgi:hypothetical protein
MNFLLHVGRQVGRNLLIGSHSLISGAVLGEESSPVPVSVRRLPITPSTPGGFVAGTLRIHHFLPTAPTDAGCCIVHSALVEGKQNGPRTLGLGCTLDLLRTSDRCQEDEWEHVQSHSGEVSGMLPSKGWQRHLDAKTGCYFLYNPLTGQSAFSRH